MTYVQKMKWEDERDFELFIAERVADSTLTYCRWRN
jgi:hypothetical protein